MAEEGYESFGAKPKPRTDLIFVICWFLQWPTCVFYGLSMFGNEWVDTNWGTIGLWNFCNHSIIANNTRRGRRRDKNEPEQCLNNERAEGPIWLDSTRIAMCFAFVSVFFGLLNIVLVAYTKEPTTTKHRVKNFLYFRWQDIMHMISACLIIGPLPVYHIQYMDFYIAKGHTDIHLDWNFYMMSVTGVLWLIISIGFFTCKDKKHVAGMNQPPADTKKSTGVKPKPGTPKPGTPAPNAHVADEVEVKSTSTLRNIASPTMVVLAVKRLASAKPRGRKNKNKNEAESSTAAPAAGSNSRRNSVTSAVSDISDVSDVSLTDYLKDIRENGGTNGERSVASPFNSTEAFVVESRQHNAAEAPTITPNPNQDTKRRTLTVAAVSGPDFTPMLIPGEGDLRRDIYDMPAVPGLPECQPPAYDDVISGGMQPPPNVVMPKDVTSESTI